MESNRNTTTEHGKSGSSTSGTTGGQSGKSTTGGATGSTGSTTGSTGSTGSPGGSTGSTSTSNVTAGSATQRAREQGSNLGNRGAEVYDQTKHAVTNAYDKTSEVLTDTYDQAMTYGRQNPGKLTLIAFGAGIAIGMLLSSGRGRSRTERIAEPVVDALSRVALEFFR
jgi:ElaB/YqjD/DUF883 family membrane-anchored ribosome-binding protein